ncbi:SgcJ/EcaC family oxidoreductase [Pontibacillus marinus]|uniref:Methionyl-tRNA formyltransferase n=1 Tax=Pontibacillus marinus BH030004 = DSM 16465 TaxID=1385511 RepID=A0A0A5FXV0_9BACI|nr:SgcJ/EcaC family oxidoreductase [Pontibacillus marinus]KGX85646.1 methionyl-tRNA formyltransferase [Pontibacillus marinus BH030004 = DSM 16465]
MNDNQEVTVKKVYEDLIKAWNERDAERMSNLFTESGESIGFDGSISKGQEQILSHLKPIFRDYPTPPFVSKIKEVKFIGNYTAILRGIAGMIPPNESDINPDLNTHHTLVLELKEDEWKIELFQNTPAHFHGRPELVDQMTNELRNLI